MNRLSKILRLVPLAGGARALARFNVRCGWTQSMFGLLELCAVKRRERRAPLAAWVLAAGLIFTLQCMASSTNSNASAAVDFSKFRGVGLIDKLGPNWFPPGKYREGDFQFAKEVGFNFVRLPVDCRFLTKDEDRENFDEAKLAEMDQAIAWGKQYGQHVCLALFAVPGYSINSPNQNPSLWSDEKCQQTFADYWKKLAGRYKKIPAAQLSFNLLNEPEWNVTEAQYAPVMRRAIDAIRSVDAQRPILVDGLKAGRAPVMSLAGLPGVGQAVHFYEPHSLTHFQAQWVPQTDYLAPPSQWPLPRLTHHLLGPKQGAHSPIKLRGPFPEGTRLEIVLGTICTAPNSPVALALTADGREVERHEIIPDESKPEWQQGKNVGDGLKEYPLDSPMTFHIPSGAEKIELKVSAGDRATFRVIRLFAGSGTEAFAMLRPTTTLWEPQVSEVFYQAGKGFEIRGSYNREWLDHAALGEWEPLLKRGVSVMVQEFGTHAKLPQSASLPYLEDCVRTWNGCSIGWALYSLRGDMGFVDSKRTDAAETSQLADGSKVDADTVRMLKRNLPVRTAASGTINFNNASSVQAQAGSSQNP